MPCRPSQEALHGWAETIVKERGGTIGPSGKPLPGYPPEHGDKCPICKRILREGQRVFRVTERTDDAWVHEEHVVDA